MARYCSNCGTRAAVGQFCTGCGAPLNRPNGTTNDPDTASWEYVEPASGAFKSPAAQAAVLAGAVAREAPRTAAAGRLPETQPVRHIRVGRAQGEQPTAREAHPERPLGAAPRGVTPTGATPTGAAPIGAAPVGVAPVRAARTRTGTDRGTIAAVILGAITIVALAVGGWIVTHRDQPGLAATTGALTTTSPASGNASPTDDPRNTVATSAVQADSALVALREQGVARLTLDGHWMAQLASNYKGMTVDGATFADGTNQYGSLDILGNFERLAARFGSDTILVGGTDFGKRSTRAETVWVTLYDPGTFDSAESVNAWCARTFQVTGQDLKNKCIARQARPPSDQ